MESPKEEDLHKTVCAHSGAVSWLRRSRRQRAMEEPPPQAAEAGTVSSNVHSIGPLDHGPFHTSRAEKLMRAVLEEKMKGCDARDEQGRLSWAYEMDECADIATDISQACHDQVKPMMGETPRYKLIFQAAVGENHGQCVRMASRCLWDKDTDNSATATWTNGKTYAVATCFALFVE